MIEIIGIVICTLVMIHVIVLIIRIPTRKHSNNQTIFLSGGRSIGEHQGEHRQILDDIDELDKTVVKSRNSVTSAFSFVYVRLYELYTGRCYDAYLEDILQIGRAGSIGNTAALVLDDPMVSKKHCMLYRRGNQILIQDLESTNHTYVNGCQIQGAVPITHGDHLSLGKSQYQFQCYYQR